jgi:hypothetical protein
VEALGELHQGEVVLDLEEGGERPLSGDPCPQIVIVAIETRRTLSTKTWSATR